MGEERIAFGSVHVGALLLDRLSGGVGAAFVTDGQAGPVAVPMAQPDPLRFVATPGLWIGLVIAAAMIAGAVWLRRNREPI